jgi:hypothetical protein
VAGVLGNKAMRILEIIGPPRELGAPEFDQQCIGLRRWKNRLSGMDNPAPTDREAAEQTDMDDRGMSSDKLANTRFDVIRGNNGTA